VKKFKIVKTTVVKDTFTIEADSAIEAKEIMEHKWEDRCEILKEDVVVLEVI
jgi:hypothetical protein